MNNKIIIPPPPEELAPFELHMAAYRQVGHKVMYARYGGDGNVVVWKNTSCEPIESDWRGLFRPRTCPKAMDEFAKRSGFQPADLPKNWRMLCGMAGLVAEEILLDHTTDVKLIYQNIDARIFFGEASDFELSLMNISSVDAFELHYEEIVEAWHYLVDNWSAVEFEAACVIDDAWSWATVNGSVNLERAVRAAGIQLH
ncbi:hypothetical protein [Duganella sp. Dugasp56]|uniref:hypothetical protein n=1 Tax=Duganella sp. Dugasp56 TaxID=3243046 RepID=UPI0039AF2950